MILVHIFRAQGTLTLSEEINVWIRQQHDGGNFLAIKEINIIPESRPGWLIAVVQYKVLR